MENLLSIIARTMIEMQLNLRTNGHWGLRGHRADSVLDFGEALTFDFDLGQRSSLRSMIDEGLLDFGECFDAATDLERLLSPRITTLQEALAEILDLCPITPFDTWRFTGIHQACLRMYSKKDQQHFHDTQSCCRACCSSIELSRVLGAPLLPDAGRACHGNEGGGWAAYRVRSQWALRAVQQVLVGESVPL